jgi:hypothetical protein
VHWKEKVQRDLAESIEVICEFPEIDGIFYVIYDDRTLPGLTKILNYALSGVINVSDFDTEGVISSLGRKKHFISRLDSLDESKRQQKINTYFNSNKKLKVILDMMVDVIRVRIDKILPENLDAGGYIPLTRVNIKKRKSLLLSFGGFKSTVAARKVYFHTTANEIYETLRELYNEEQDNLELEHAKEEYERMKKSRRNIKNVK